MLKRNGNTKRPADVPSAGPQSTNQIVAGTVLTGDMETTNDLRFDGTLKGNMNCRAKVVQGASSVIEGNMNAATAIVEGTVEGDVMVDDLLTLKPTAKVHGNISSKRLVVEDGAQIDGHIRIGGGNNGNTGTTKPATEQA